MWGQSYAEVNPGTNGLRWGPLMADSRGYQVWLMPDGHIGAQFWTDGGNSVLTRDPWDLTKPNPIEKMSAWQSSSGGMASLYLRIDPTGSEPRIVGGTFVRSHVTHLAVDPWGRVYLPRAIRHRDASSPPSAYEGQNANAGGGLMVLGPNLLRPEFNRRLGGGKQGDGQETFGRIAISGNILLLGGTTNSTSLPNRATGAGTSWRRSRRLVYGDSTLAAVMVLSSRGLCPLGLPRVGVRSRSLAALDGPGVHSMPARRSQATTIAWQRALMAGQAEGLCPSGSPESREHSSRSRPSADLACTARLPGGRKRPLSPGNGPWMASDRGCPSADQTHSTAGGRKRPLSPGI